MTGLDAQHLHNGAMIFRQDRDFRYISVHNPLFGLRVDQMIGRPETDIFPAEFTAKIKALKEELVRTGKSQNQRLEIAWDGEDMTIDITISPINVDGGEMIGLVGCMVDMTRMQRREQQLNDLTTGLAELTARLNLALDGSMITIFEQDTDLRYTFMNNPPRGTSVEDFIGISDHDLFAKDQQLTLFEAKMNLIRSAEPVQFETTVDLAGEPRTYDVKLQPRIDSNGDVFGLIGVAVDMTERKNHEEHWHLVMREMTHRSKNLLAVIQAMARQTAARSQSAETFVRDFTRRLQAMSSSHDLLVNANWLGVGMQRLVKMHISQVVDLDTAQVSIHGDDVALNASTVQNLGLALHELVTNAVKYGSLSVPEGRLEITWLVEESHICIEWIESDGPPVVPSERSGFGRNLLESAIGASLDGAVDLQFKAEGLVCRIIIPRQHIVVLDRD